MSKQVYSLEMEDFFSFLNNAPTAWHACCLIQERLKKQGFEELKEDASWKIKKGGRYYVIRGGSSCIAFQLPKQSLRSSLIVYSHTDSPALKLKPQGIYEKEGFILAGLEAYGSPILSSWIGRDLTFSGRLFYRHKNQSIGSVLVHYPEPLLTIPHLAIHLDRHINETGHQLHKQEQLSAILSLKGLSDVTTEGFLSFLFSDFLPRDAELLHHELFAVPYEKASSLGADKEFIMSYRLDNLGGVHACLKALLTSKKNHSDKALIAVFSHHEEVGSETFEGAGSSFFLDTLNRLFSLLGLEGEATHVFKARSSALSVDLAHAIHPNYSDRLDPRHIIRPGAGVIFKVSSQEKYSSQADVLSRLIALCIKDNIPYSFFAPRNDIPSGKTVGPIHASRMGIKTVDVGYPQLAMHSCREMIAYQDHCTMIRFLTTCLEERS